MANNGEFIEGLSDSALASIKEFVKEVDKGSLAVEKINKAFASTKIPSANRNAIAEANTELARSNVVMTEAEKLTVRLSNARTEEALEIAKLKIELANLTAENKKSAMEALGQLNSYQKLSSQLNTMRTEVKATATDMYLLEQSGKKNSDEYRKLSSAYDENIKKVTQLDTVLKKIDASAGQHQRSVGNYASGYSGLNNSIQQILREAPAAAVSLNTFFLGISNNLPIFFDEISKITAETKAFREANLAASADIHTTTVAQQQATAGFRDAERALKSNVSTVLSSLDVTAAQRTSIREQIAIHKIETKTLGQATAATMAKTESILLNAGATREQITAIIAQIEATALASRTSAEQTALLNAQTLAQLENNAAVAASPSLMKRLAASIFSIQTLLTVGVLALTLYGGKLVEVAKKWFEGANAADAMKQSMTELNTIRIASVKSVVKEGIELNQNLKIAKNVKLSLQEREIAAKKVLDQYPFWFENLGKEAILQGNVQKAVEGVNAALLSRAKTNAAVGKITENQSLIIDLEEERLKITKQLDVAQESYNGRLKVYEETKDPSVNTALALSESTLTGIRKDYVANEKEISRITEINNRLLGYANDESAKAIGLDYKATKEKKNKNKAQKEEIDYLATVYALRKKNNDVLASAEERTMNDEEKNFSNRIEAMENYYFQRQTGADMAYEEEKRLNDLSFAEQNKRYKKAIADGTAVQETLNQIEYQYLVNKQLIRANFEDQSNQITIEKAKALQGVLASITDQEQKNVISEKSVEDAKQIGLYLANISGETTLRKFEELDKKLKKISDDEKARNQESLRIDLQRIIAEEDRIKASLLPDEVLSKNQSYIDLKAKEIELNKQLQESENESAQETADTLRKKAEAMAGYLRTFTEGFFGESGFPTLFKALSNEIEGFGEDFATTFVAIAEIAQETLNFLNQNQQAYFDAQYDRLEKEKDIAIEFAGDSATAKEEIERQYEERRRDIRRKEAEAQKELAIFNAIINTAQGVVAALANPGGPAGVILAAAVGVIGAAQIALISQQSIPEYRMGTDFHQGGLAMVGDGGKHEVVYQPSSGFSVTPKNDTLVDLERGTKVYPDFNTFLKNSGSMLGGIPNISLEQSGISYNEMDKIMAKYSQNNSNEAVLSKTKILSFVGSAHGKQQSANDRFTHKVKRVN